MSYEHEFRSALVVNGRMLLLEYAVTAWIPVLCVREALTTQQPSTEVIQLLFVAAAAVFILGCLTWSWLESRCFGEAICRLSTHGGERRRIRRRNRVQSSVESVPLVVGLESRAALSKFPRRHWQVERRVDACEFRPLGARRIIVPVRFDIPGHRPAAAPSGAVWALQIACTRWGMTFHAEVVMPVMDVPAADAEPVTQ
jgi:hypothetical protein